MSKVCNGGELVFPDYMSRCPIGEQAPKSWAVRLLMYAIKRSRKGVYEFIKLAAVRSHGQSPRGRNSGKNPYDRFEHAASAEAHASGRSGGSRTVLPLCFPCPISTIRPASRSTPCSSRSRCARAPSIPCTGTTGSPSPLGLHAFRAPNMSLHNAASPRLARSFSPRPLFANEALPHRCGMPRAACGSAGAAALSPGKRWNSPEAMRQFMPRS